MAAITPRRSFVSSLPFGCDLLDEITKIARREGITLGRLQGIGATSRAVVAYYDQETRKYLPLEFTEGMEILSLMGNISLRDNKPFVHAHVTLGDRDGKVFGGHLMRGTVVFACEVFIEEFEGDERVREADETTGLFLWKYRE